MRRRPSAGVRSAGPDPGFVGAAECRAGGENVSLVWSDSVESFDWKALSALFENQDVAMQRGYLDAA